MHDILTLFNELAAVALIQTSRGIPLAVWMLTSSIEPPVDRSKIHGARSGPVYELLTGHQTSKVEEVPVRPALAPLRISTYCAVSACRSMFLHSLISVLGSTQSKMIFCVLGPAITSMFINPSGCVTDKVALPASGTYTMELLKHSFAAATALRLLLLDALTVASKRHSKLVHWTSHSPALPQSKVRPLLLVVSQKN